MGDDDIGPEPDELCRELAGAIGSSSGVADLKRNLLPFETAKGSQATSERVHERVWWRRAHQHADTRQLWLCCRLALPTEQGGGRRTDEEAPRDRHVRLG